MKWALPLVIIVGLMLGLLIPGPEQVPALTVGAGGTVSVAEPTAQRATPAPDDVPAPAAADMAEQAPPMPLGDVPDYMPAPVRARGGVPPTIS